MTNELYHYGIRGMHWGVRRYQNYDGTLTGDGRKKYNLPDNKYDEKHQKQDMALYGRGGVRRIAKSIGRGGTMTSARAREKQAYSSARSKAVLASVGAGIIGSKIFLKAGKETLYSVLSSNNPLSASLRADYDSVTGVAAAVSVGSIIAGNIITSKLAYNTVMLASGYGQNEYAER